MSSHRQHLFGGLAEKYADNLEKVKIEDYGSSLVTLWRRSF